jgi:hypothetical protein
VQLGDFGFEALKKYYKIFYEYEILSKWSAPEIWKT